MKKKLKVVLIVSFICIVIAEFSLRSFLGLGDAVLFRKDEAYEYIAKPNQDRFRFGNKIKVNSFSMRSPELSPSDSLYVLLFGDSIINGGAQTDQDSLASSKLSAFYSQKLNKPVLFLNISAGSWGPDNCYQYLMKHGNFGSSDFVVVVSSHDAYDNMDFKPTVGVHPSYPSRQYPLAIFELVDRYLLPRLGLKKSSDDEILINKQTENSKFNPGFNQFAEYCSKNNITLTFYLHADKAEFGKQTYNEQGQEIIRFCESNRIPLIRQLDYTSIQDIYRDNIHPNEAGQDVLFRDLSQLELNSKRTK